MNFLTHLACLSLAAVGTLAICYGLMYVPNVAGTVHMMIRLR